MFDNNSNNAAQSKSSPYNSFELFGLYVFHLLSLPPQMLLRKKFGKRHLRIFHVSFLSITIYLLWVGVITSASFLLSQKDTVLTWFYLLSVTIAATAHAIEISLRKKKSVVIHSYYTGYPRILPYIPELITSKFKEWDINLEVWVKMYAEPLICLIVGLLAAQIEPFLAMLIILGGMGLYVWGQYKRSFDDDKNTDITDGLIESGQLQEMLNDGGVNFGLENYAKSSKVISKAKSVAQKREEANLTPELQKLLNEEEEEDDYQSQARPRSTVKAGINTTSRKENLVDSTPVRPRGRPKKEVNAAYP